MYRHVVTSPDGVEWQVRVLRVRIPEARQSDYHPSVDGTSTFDVVGRPSGFDALEYLIIGPVMWFLVPMLRILCLLPFEVVRGLASRRRWVQADSQWPHDGMEI